MVPQYLMPEHGEPDLSILCRDGVVLAHKAVLAKALTTFAGAFFPNGTPLPQGPDSIGANGNVLAAQHFLCELYGHEIKVIFTLPFVCSFSRFFLKLLFKLATN